MSLLTVEEARALVKTGLNDAHLQMVIDQEEEWIVQAFGAHYVDANTTVSDSLQLSLGSPSLFLRRRITSVTTVIEDGETIPATDYRLWGKQGRIERLPAGTLWLPSVLITVTYVPHNDNGLRKSAITELARLRIERTSMKSESIAGEYSYTAPEWEAVRRGLVRGLGFPAV